MAADPLEAAAAIAIASVKARRQRSTDSGCPDHPAVEDEIRACLSRPYGFEHFVRHWRFLNRDESVYTTFGKVGLFAGQQKLVRRMQDSLAAGRWVFALKAGKLGFTELACAYDGWELVSRQLTRVHIFSRDSTSAKALLGWVRTGIAGLPGWMGVSIATGERGGDIDTQFQVRLSRETRRALRLDPEPEDGETAGAYEDRCAALAHEDVRTAVAYAAGKNVSIDQVARHSHVDELSHMPFAEATWGAVSTTVPRDGSLHVVTRGQGEGAYSGQLWKQCLVGRDDDTLEVLNPNAVTSRLDPIFCPWWDRDDRDRRWYELQKATMPLTRLMYFAPETWKDALTGDLESPYIPLERWDQLTDPYLVDNPPLPGRPEGLVMAADAAVSADCFGVVLASRHPLHPDRPAIRAARKWSPEVQSDNTKRIDSDDVKRWIFWILQGGCRRGHPMAWVVLDENADDPNLRHPIERMEKRDDLPCEDCRRLRLGLPGAERVPAWDVVQFTYDPHQLEWLADEIKREHLCWVSAFNQGDDRLVADAGLFSFAMTGVLGHNGDPDLREHIGNAKAKLQPDEDSKMRIVKRSESAKVDLAVCASMACDRVMSLNLA